MVLPAVTGVAQLSRMTVVGVLSSTARTLHIRVMQSKEIVQALVAVAETPVKVLDAKHTLVFEDATISHKRRERIPPEYYVRHSTLFSPLQGQKTAL